MAALRRRGASTQRSAHDGLDGAQDWIADTLIKPFTDIAVKALGSAGAGVANAFDLLAEPQKGMEKGLAGGAEMARMAYAAAARRRRAGADARRLADPAQGHARPTASGWPGVRRFRWRRSRRSARR